MIRFARFNTALASLCAYVKGISAVFWVHIGLGADVLLPACSG